MGNIQLLLVEVVTATVACFVSMVYFESMSLESVEDLPIEEVLIVIIAGLVVVCSVASALLTVSELL